MFGAAAEVPVDDALRRIRIDGARDVRGVYEHRALRLEDLDCLGHRLGLAWIEAAALFLAAGRHDLVVVEGARDADARAAKGIGLEERRVVAARRRRAPRGRGVVGIGARAFEGAEQNHGVGDGARHRAGRVLIRGNRNHAPAADPSDRRLHGGEHRGVRRPEDRPGRFGADAGGPEIGRGAAARARPGGRQGRPAVSGRRARVAARIVGIETDAADRVVAAGRGRWRPGGVAGQLRHRRLGDDDRAGVDQVLRERRLVGRDEAVEGERAAGRRHVRRVDVVLQRDWNAVQRAPHLAGRALAIAFVGILQRVGVDVDRGAEHRLIHPDAREVHLDQVVRCQPPLLHRLTHLRDGRLDDLEWRRGWWRRWRCGALTRGREHGGGSDGDRAEAHGARLLRGFPAGITPKGNPQMTRITQTY